MKTQSEKDAICCPKFDPALYDEKILVWENKLFVKGRVCTIFYMPLNYGGAIRRLTGHIAKGKGVILDYMMLSDHTSKWNMNIYIAVDKEVKGVENEKFSGKYFCKVFEGSFKKTGKWCKEFEQVATAKGYKFQKLLMWYTTCPKCAKKYGKNYVAILAEVE